MFPKNILKGQCIILPKRISENFTKNILSPVVRNITKNSFPYNFLFLAFFQVLEGNATIYIHQTRIKKWDLCAGNSLVNALGGTMVTLKREKISYSPNSNHVVEDGLLVELNKNVIIGN